jgi:general secretion pathway protein D
MNSHILLRPGAFVALPLFLFARSALSQDVRRITEHEVARRQAGVSQGEAALARGQAAMQGKDYATAHEDFRVAVSYLPDALTTANQHDAAVKGFCESGVKLAEQKIAASNYHEAEEIVKEVTSDRYDPNYRPALEILARLSDPGYYNKTISPKFIAKVEEVRKLLDDAESYYQTGRYDLAFKKYEQVLAIDPYNVAARRGEERINLTRTHYSEEAYNETRSRSLWQVQKGWEEPVHKYDQEVNPIADAFARDAGGTARITNKLNSIIIPKIEFRDASVREAIDFIRQQAAENDPVTEGKRGVDIVLRTTPLGRTTAPAVDSSPSKGATGETEIEPTPVPTHSAAAVPIGPAEARVTLTLTEIPLGEALRYIATQAGLKVKVEPYAVSIIPINEQSADLFTKEYRVPPGFISSTVNVGANPLDRPATRVGTPTAAGTQETTG